MSHKVLYILWALIPLFFFLLALWSKLEQIGGKKRQEHPEDFLKQGLFVLFCVFIAMGIDYSILAPFHEAVMPSIVPLALLQVLLLPFVLLVVAKIMGPTKDILISKAPSSERKRR